MTLQGNYTLTLEDAPDGPGFQLSPGPEIAVLEVARAGWAEENGVLQGDALLEIGDQTVAKLQSVEEAMKSRPLKLTFRRLWDFQTSKELGSIYTILAVKAVTKMGIRPNREPPQESVQILSVTPKGWAEEQGVQVADHLMMINHKPVTTLPRDEYHRLMSSVRPLLFTFARCSEAQKREVAATRMQLLYRMRKARQAMKEKKAERDAGGNAVKPAEGSTPTPAKAAKEPAPSNGVDGEGSAATKIQAAVRGALQRQALALQCANLEDKTQMPYTVLVPAVVNKLGFKTKAFPPRSRIPVVNVDPNGWAFKTQIHKGDELIKVQRKVLPLMKPSEFTHVVLNQRPLSLTFLRGDSKDDDMTYSLTLPKGILAPGFQLEALPPQSKLFIASVVPESWAASNGVEQNHRLIKMDGYNAARMSSEEFGRILKLRPLRLEFGHGFHLVTLADASVKHLGFRLYNAQVLAVMPGGWAASVGVMIGDEMLAIGAGKAKTLEELSRLELRKLMAEVRPLKITFRHGDVGERQRLSVLRLQAYFRGELLRRHLRRSPEADALRDAVHAAAMAAKTAPGSAGAAAAAAGQAALGSLTLNGVSLPLQMETLAEVVAGCFLRGNEDSAEEASRVALRAAQNAELPPMRCAEAAVPRHQGR
eukprot:s316_g1.t2